ALRLGPALHPKTHDFSTSTARVLALERRGLGTPAAALNVYESAWIIEVIDTGVGVVHVQATGIDHDFPRRIELHVGTVHGPRRRPFEIDGFGIVAAAMARALELVLAGLPFRRATQMSATGENDEEPIGLLDHPDAIGHQEALIHTQTEIRGIADGENSIRLI